MSETAAGPSGVTADNDMMIEHSLTETPDLTLIVDNRLKPHVSYAILLSTGSEIWKRMLTRGSPEGDAFVSHKTNFPNTPYVKHLDEDDPLAMAFYCCALHEGYRPIRDAEWSADVLVSFAETANKYGGLAQVRTGAEIAMRALPLKENAFAILRAAFLFDHAEYSSMLTDWIVKYWDKNTNDVPEELRKLDVDFANPKHNVYDLLKARRRKYLEELSTAREKASSDLANYFHFSHHHIACRRYTHTSCTLHYKVIMACQIALIHMKVKPEVSDSTFKLVRDIHNIPQQPPATNHLRTSDCEKARSVLKCFEDGLQRLRSEAESNWAGVCLPCFKAGLQPQLCSHVRFVAPCPCYKQPSCPSYGQVTREAWPVVEGDGLS